MKILTISDSFKGTLSSLQVGNIVSDELTKKGYEADYWPIADGGEGFLDVYQKVINSTFYKVDVTGVFFNIKKEAQYLFKDDIAYVELASSSGIKDVKGHLNPYLATTYGVGEVIKKIIITHHPKKIIIGVGGSASIDLGTGMLEAMAMLFYDINHQEIHNMCHYKLKDVEKIDTTSFDNLIKGIEFVTLSDVTAPILGPNGGLYAYTPQKGASIEDLLIMEANIKKYLSVIKESVNDTFVDRPFLGSAGGITYSLKYFCHSEIKLGIDVLLESLCFKELVKTYDVIITGEGQVDEQTLQGKVISGIIKYQPKRLIIITGFAKVTYPDLEIYAIVPKIATLKESLNNPLQCLRKLINTIKI